MSKASSNANAVGYGIVQTCALYGVEVLRMQSRVVTVTGAAGRSRPMFFGQWVDRNGNPHASGMADYLARPLVPVEFLFDGFFKGYPPPQRKIPVCLWIEAKSGRGAVTADQAAFKCHVEANHEFWELVHDDLRPLIQWFESHGVKR